jgi:hypothetical protein
MDVYQLGIVILLGLAVSDLIVGVSNDAVNFLNSSIGSRVAPRHVILIIASLGMLAGVTFSSGMMEVARKGIFHPQLFTMPELMTVFLAVMLTDIILLDLFNTFGLPTSTTVSIVFELLGAAVIVSLFKIHEAGESFGELVNYINTAKALAIIGGILLSVVIAFGVGAIIQLISRLIFTFQFQSRLRRYGAVWGGVALASIIFFIVIKGAKGASFLTDETTAWIGGHTWTILVLSFLVSTAFLQALILLTRVSILKVIVLAGTFALAMAFAANDLVNFIGVPLAGLSAYQVADASGDLVGHSMEALRQPVRSNTLHLLVAGLVMVVTLWLSRKARTVTKTEVSLGRQDEGLERFESTALSQAIVRSVASLFQLVRRVIPRLLRRAAARRLRRPEERSPFSDPAAPSFDLVRASVNLMVASALISFGTSLKLPLSTTYVTFMVAMGSSLSDRAWGRESAVYRVTGVLTVIGGWFFTAFMAFTVSSIFGAAIFLWGAPAVVAIAALAGFLLLRSRIVHRVREEDEQALEVFNLRKIRDSAAAIRLSFEHAGIFLAEVRQAVNEGFEGLVQEDRTRLRLARRRQKKIQIWANILVANIFKILRLLQQETAGDTLQYARTISTLQEIAESQRDIIMRARKHVANSHAPLLAAQVEDLRLILAHLDGLLTRAADALRHREQPDPEFVKATGEELRRLSAELDRKQIARIQSNTSKTRLSILFYGFMWDALKIAEQTTSLLEIFQDPLRLNGAARKPTPPVR